VTDDGLLLREIAEGVELEEVREKTEAELIISEDLKTF
jgi:acetate CoA/acetoacetate CoA-transferase beta subunit